jgi:hypothetical protein
LFAAYVGHAIGGVEWPSLFEKSIPHALAKCGVPGVSEG